MAVLLTKWSFDPTVVAGLAALCVIYWRCARGANSQLPTPISHRNDRLFGLMVALTLLALESPLDYISDRYLFSAHMLQHLVLILGVAPLLALTLLPPLMARAPRLVGQPALVFAVFVVDVWAWHAPFFYEAALHSELVHALEHLSFAATAALFWWVALAPGDPDRALPVLARMAYVFVGSIPNIVLGAVLTFSPVLYGSYRVALESPGLGRMLQAQFGLTPAVDQELGGLLMWVPGGLIYLVIILAIFVSWSSRSETSLEEPALRVAA